METIILASGSPRRQEYFKQLGLPFIIFPALIDEDMSTETDPQKLTSDLAVRKIREVTRIMEGQKPKWICGADTVISMGGKIFGKPSSREEARGMLCRLSGKRHNVTTSVALYNGWNNEIDCRSAVCQVSFAPMNFKEIEWYLNTNEWQGVAGSYRIQGLAACFITQIKGAPSTVAGLPLRDFYAMLRDNGYPYGA
jgi:septum formation protein